jgi:hypothetical protein
MGLDVKHNHSENNFSCRTGDTHALIAYSRKQGALSIDRVFIPVNYEDSPLIDQLIRSVFRYCRNQDLQIIANHPAIVEFIENNPGFSPLLKTKTVSSKGADFLRL